MKIAASEVGAPRLTPVVLLRISIGRIFSDGPIGIYGPALDLHVEQGRRVTPTRIVVSARWAHPEVIVDRTNAGVEIISDGNAAIIGRPSWGLGIGNAKILRHGQPIMGKDVGIIGKRTIADRRHLTLTTYSMKERVLRRLIIPSCITGGTFVQ